MPSIISKIPYLKVPDKPLTATTQEELPIADIVDNLVVFKDGGVALVLESTSLNFGLLSDKEQEAVIAAYAAMINSLSFSIQIVVRTLRKDITSYLNYVQQAREKIKNDKLRELMDSYRDFISDTVKKKNVLGKRFFIVLAFSPLELGVGKSMMIVANRTAVVPYSQDYVMKKAKIVLYPRRDHIVRQANRLGLKLTQLDNTQLVELYYEIFNPKVPRSLVEQPL